MNELGIYLKKLRGEKSIREISKQTGISHTYLSTLEKGYDPRTKKERKPTPEVLKKLSAFYDIPYGTLMLMAGYIEDNDPFKDAFKDSKNTLTKTTDIDVRYILNIKEVAYYNGKVLTDKQRKHAVDILDALFKEV